MVIESSSLVSILFRKVCSYVSLFHWLVGIHVCGPKKGLNHTLAIWLTFPNIRSRTFRQIYRPALPLLCQEMLSSSNKSRFFLNDAHLSLFDWMDDPITRTNTSVSIIISKLELALEVRTLLSPFTSRIIVNRESMWIEELCFRTGLLLHAG